MLTFCTWPMAGSQGRGLIQKEQLRVPPRSHDLPVPSTELEDTRDPSPAGKRAPDALLIVVKAAAVAHQCTPGLGGNQFPEWSDAILPGHTAIFCPRARLWKYGNKESWFSPNIDP